MTSAERRRQFERCERDGWARRAETYDTGFGALCAGAHAALLDAAGIGTGTRALEVGCGSGRLSAAAADRGATVIACDPVPGMVAQAAVPGVTATLPDLPFAGGTFDVVLAAFVLNHVPDATAALAELHRVLRPGGRIAASIWADDRENRALGVVSEAIRDAGVRPAGGIARYSPLAGTSLTELVRDTGFRAAREWTHSWQHRVRPAGWWQAVCGGTVRTAAVLEELDDGERRRVRAAFDRAVAGYRTPAGAALPAAATLVYGER